jgi:formate dehydrogenase major subunit
VTTVPDAILSGQVKMLYVMGENPVVADPDTNHIKKALEKAFVVVQDIFENETADYADVVLPSACFAETDGTFTNTERRVQRVRKAAPGKGEAREDWQILMEVMNRIGYPVSYESSEDIFEELRQVTPSYAGMTWDRIDEDGLCWPCPSADHPGTPILHKQGPIIGKGRLMAVEHDPSPETQLTEYPIVLMTGRVLEHYHTRTMTRLTEQIQNRYPENFLEINLVDADELGIADGDRVLVTSRRGTTTAVAVLSTGLRVGTAFMPFHFAEGANLLTDGEALDPTSKIPGFKQTGVRIERVLP